jgi:hypothetical protein
VIIQEIFYHGVADSFHLPASQRQMKKDRSLCVLGVLSVAGGNSLKLKLTIYDLIYFMHSVVINDESGDMSRKIEESFQLSIYLDLERAIFI